MPTIKQLPAATVATAGDLLPLSQGGLTRSISVSTLLSSTQPNLSLPQDALLGRVSIGVGSPETVGLGTGLSIQAGSVIASGTDHVSFMLSAGLVAGDEVIINTNGQPARLIATQLRALFSAGSGVAIDTNGVISATASGSSGTSSTGAQGPKGDTGAPGPAGQGFNFRGPWQGGTAYGAYDVLTFGGQTYVAVSSFVSGSTFGNQNLSLVAAQGATGPAGAAGPTVAATTATIGAVKPGSGLSVASDGSLSISTVIQSTIAQNGATVGQVLGWNGTSWGPATVSASAATGVAPIGVSNGTISLLQSGALAGQVLTWTGSAWAPQTSAGLTLGNATPLGNGSATAGASGNAARDDHRHPTDVTRAPAANPVFSGSIVLPTWTSSSRPSSPVVGMAGYATDTGRLETYSSSSWVQYVRAGDIPAATGQLLGGTSTAGSVVAISLGSGLSLSGNTLSATGGGNSSIPVATTTTLGGIKSDGATVSVGSDGTLSVVGVAVGSLVDVSSGSLGGPALSDVDIVNRGGSDYRTTLGARASLFRRTPAGSRTITLASGATTATLTASDNDRTVVVSGVAGTLAVDGTVADGFRCQVINHTGSALAYSGITGLQGSSSVANNAACWVTMSGSAVEATVPGGAAASYTLPPATAAQLGGVKVDGTTVQTTTDGTLSVVTVSTHALSAAASPAASDEFQGYSTATSTDLKYTLGQISAFGQANFQSWTTAARPTLGAGQYAQGFNTTLGRFEFWNGTTWNQHARLSGDTLTGPLVLAADPAMALGAATKQYVDAQAANAPLPITSTYTASGAIAVSDKLAVLNSTSSLAMTLDVPTVNGQRLKIKRFGSGSATITLKLDGATGAVITANSGSLKEMISLIGIVSDPSFGTTWLAD